MADLAELDLTKPGKIWATPEFETTTTFHMVVPKEDYSKAKLIQNRNANQNAQIPPADSLMAPFAVPHAQLDKEGRAVLDLQKSGKAKELMASLERKLNENNPIHVMRALIIADHAPGNHVPDKVAVETIDFQIAAFPIISLIAKTVTISAAQMKTADGPKAFAAEFRTTLPLKEVKVSIEPSGTPVDFEVAGQKFKGSGVVQVKEGQPYQIVVPVTVDQANVKLLTAAQKADWMHFYNRPDNLVSRSGAKITNPMESIPADRLKAGGLFKVTVNQKLVGRKPVYSSRHPWSSWREYDWTWKGQSGSYVIHDYDGYVDIQTEEKWAKADYVLKVEGTGAYSGTVKTLPLSLSGFAVDFTWGNQPRVFGHNAC